MEALRIDSDEEENLLSNGSGVPDAASRRSQRVSLVLVAMLLVAGCGSAFLIGRPGTMHTSHMVENKDLMQRYSCGPAPLIDGQPVDSFIHGRSTEVLLIANPQMRCTQAAISALDSQGLSYNLKEFQTPFQYEPGVSDIWDWLHCSYPNDMLSSGTVMHSYVFNKGAFLGNGFTAAEKIQSGAIAGTSEATSCEEKFPDEAATLAHFQGNSANDVLLFGWLACPCTTMAQTRFAETSVCYDGRTWADPYSKLMAYLQCKEGYAHDHSFVYFRNTEGNWDFIGNGFLFDERAMPDDRFQSLVASSGAATTCHHANVKVNVFGTPLEECRVNPDDMMGSWQDDGTCSEQIGGIHEICIEHLPADFSSETHQTPWSEDRANQRHCVCVGAWSLYMSDADKHPEHAAEIMPHCRAIPETALTPRYLANWKDWNGYPADVVQGVGKLVERCLGQVSDWKMKCGLRDRFNALKEQVPDLRDAYDLSQLSTELGQLYCS